MAGVLKGTAAASNPNDGTAYIGKTGTTDSAWHTWMVGSSTAASTAVWVGNVTGTQNLRKIYINKVQVAVLRHRIFKPLAQAIDKTIPNPGPNAFPKPPASFLVGSPAFVPDGLVGGTPGAAQAAITTAELTYADGGQIDSNQPAGTVASTNPGGGAQVPRGTTVTVYTSNGLAVSAPNVIGMSYGGGQSAFQAQGFTNISQACQAATGPTDPNIDKIVSQVPSSGAVVNKSTPVVLTVKKWPAAACP
jgi:membrane peptidoglycan carboxypeptidase